jgi:hypothetical protein
MDSREGNGLGGMYSSAKGLTHKILITSFFKGSINEKLDGYMEVGARWVLISDCGDRCSFVN